MMMHLKHYTYIRVYISYATVCVSTTHAVSKDVGWNICSSLSAMCLQMCVLWCMCVMSFHLWNYIETCRIHVYVDMYCMYMIYVYIYVCLYICIFVFVCSLYVHVYIRLGVIILVEHSFHSQTTRQDMQFLFFLLSQLTGTPGTSSGTWGSLNAKQICPKNPPVV